MSLRTVAVIVVNDKVLQGKCEITLSTSFLLTELSALGYETKKISVLPEDEKSIAVEIRHLSKKYDVILVVEDLECNSTYGALESVFSSKKQLHNRFMDCLHKTSKSAVSSASKNLFLPSAAKILTKDFTYPVVFLQRIFLLKIELHTEQFTRLLRDHLSIYRMEKLAKKCIVLRKTTPLPPLEKLHTPTNNVFLIFEEGLDDATLEVISPELDALNKFIDDFRDKYSENIVKLYVPQMDSSAVLFDDGEHIKSSINDISKCFETYGPENVFMAFNGGKDCTVLLHLVNYVLRTNYSNFDGPIYCLYVQSEHPFPEQDEFLQQCQKYYGLKVKTVQSGMKDALAEMLKENGNLRACLMGTRRTDPYSMNLSIFQMTDPDWPQVMRVNPLLNWHHSDIWDYILYYKVFYCVLYDAGYTSLGSINNTSKNPSLACYDCHEDKEAFLPAYRLLNELKERCGRN